MKQTLTYLRNCSVEYPGKSVKRDNVPRRGGQSVKHRDAQTNKPVCAGTLAEDMPS